MEDANEKNTATPNEEPSTPCDSQAADPLDGLPPELRSVAVRHGLPLLNHSLRVANLNFAVDVLLKGTRTSQGLQNALAMVLEELAGLNAEVLDLRKWTIEQMIECIQDAGRAKELARKDDGSTRH